MAAELYIIAQVEFFATAVHQRTDTMATRLLTYPAWGYQHESGDWRVHISGVSWISPVEFNRRQKMLIRVVGNKMQATDEELASDIFRERVSPFLAEGDHKRLVCVNVGGREFVLRRRTRRNGHFRNWITVPRRLIETTSVAHPEQAGRMLPFSIWVEGESETRLETQARLLPPHGISVVSDIDDTIKHSGVEDKSTLLRNTFLNDYKGVSQMASLYQQWSDMGACFHYVSSSPWPLYGPLMDMKRDHLLPFGTMHLRNFRIRDELLKKFIIRRQGKRLAIRKLMKCYPTRDFVLIGDSGEKDPEIYLKVTRRGKGRIKGLFIRDLPHNPMDVEIYAKIRKALAGSPLIRFRDGEDLKQKAGGLISELTGEAKGSRSLV